MSILVCYCFYKMAVLNVIVDFIAKLIGAESEAPGVEINSQV
jgi:hypothetical protein